MQRSRDGLGATTTNVRRADSDDFEGLCIMDRYFCKAENPKDGELERYLNVIKKEAHFGYLKYVNSFKVLGFEESDVYSLSLCYATSFLGLYSLQKDKSKMERFVERFQKLNKTNTLPSEEVLFKKNSSDMIDFLKQKISTLATVAKKNCKSFLFDNGSFSCFKTKTKEEVVKSNLPNVPDGFRGYFKIDKKEFMAKQKQLGTRRHEFELDGWTYFSVRRTPKPLSTFESEVDFENNDVDIFEKYGSVEQTDSFEELLDRLDCFPRNEKIKKIKNFIKKSKKEELVDLAKDVLARLK